MARPPRKAWVIPHAPRVYLQRPPHSPHAINCGVCFHLFISFSKQEEKLLRCRNFLPAFCPPKNCRFNASSSASHNFSSSAGRFPPPWNIHWPFLWPLLTSSKNIWNHFNWRQREQAALKVLSCPFIWTAVKRSHTIKCPPPPKNPL